MVLVSWLAELTGLYRGFGRSPLLSTDYWVGGLAEFRPRIFTLVDPFYIS